MSGGRLFNSRIRTSRAGGSTRFERMRRESRIRVLTPHSSVEECSMRLATAWSRRITEALTRSWRHVGRLGKLAVVGGVALCLALGATAARFSLGAATTDTRSLRGGLPVPPHHLHAIKNAAASCPPL